MLDNKKILITGSSRGIGASIARLAKDYGAEVVLHGKEESDELKKLASELDCQYISFDLSKDEEVKKVLSKISNLDILVNNAGINPSRTFSELSAEEWKDIFNVNLFGLVNVSKEVLPGMIKNGGGRIINISSIKALDHVSGKPAYAASKAAVSRLTSSMATEFAKDNILINAVAPGFTQTSMTDATMSDSIKKQIDKIPLGRLAKTNEIAEMVLFLASEKSSYITGQTIVVDGGYSVA